MGTKRHKPEDVVAKLRQADVLIAQGQPELGGSELDRALKVIEGCLAVRGIAVHLAS
ncbi:hypothetical protein [Methylobacterium gnaphalii]|uniref:Uncharacterized protein n=1 Tax=Methylobacterium gnaphalii TaxID=1010610 RepID=A0A512JQD1_9HYPH|nr:hypothetical protein [Methylobacterium gnaphalii]GEP12158.1 hypothetical protein MGN01_40030 [Methylobacterium gnaphalii]GJD70023.1 hypothetical protein MMMDOFMJ_2963 [Methylobacterium gnaphalii]GLS48917.1 hypothetical protein GCM10007885_17640 [Methylobacterium gnaphalii]